jgi:Fe-S-cluster-containing hydrogenase component 2
LHAIFIQDKVFMGSYSDPHYVSLRKEAFIVAVNCSQAASTCFCASMNTGPKADHGFDLSLTEVLNESAHYILVQVGSAKGEAVLSELPRQEAATREIDDANAIVERTAAAMTRKLDTTGIKALLQENHDHPRWDVVADRCLSCANCTMVCPTCFCHTIEDITDLTGSHAERWRKWDSCFTIEFSYIHGGSIRTSPKARYRQWLTHKLAHWIDQFGTSGCVGCGRCITWCPVGIDITEEVHALRESAPARHTSKSTSVTISQSEVNHHGVS